MDCKECKNFEEKESIGSRIMETYSNLSTYTTIAPKYLFIGPKNMEKLVKEYTEGQGASLLRGKFYGMDIVIIKQEDIISVGI